MALWSKIRYDLQTDPRVLKIASLIAPNLAPYAFTAAAKDLFQAEPVLHQRVLRDVTVAALQRVWQRVAQHGCNGVIVATSLSVLDQYAEIPNFGAAMAAVHWAEYCSEKQQIILPDFHRYNLQKSGPRSEGPAKSSTERSRERRERLKAERERARLIATATATDCNGNGNGLQHTEREEDSTTTTTGKPPPVGETDLPTLIAATAGCTPEIAKAWLIDRNRAQWIYRKGTAAIPITAETAQADLASFTHHWLTNAQSKAARPTTPGRAASTRPKVLTTTPKKDNVF